ncbi:MAG: lipopolysaccharide biosynthesis protein [Lachnoclostridium sp.]|nr:lipopolysaccharide biosynthesis protein [Lachnoclostridium sp.]
MNQAARLIIGKDDGNLEKQNIVWNMIGSFLYAFASMILSIAVVQIAGEDAGGVFTFAFSTLGQHMFTIAYFGIRPFHITDTGNQYTFGEYLGLRWFTCAAALLVGMAFVAVNGYSFEKAMSVIYLVAYKVIDGLADAYEAEFQRNGRLYLTGKSNAFRTILSVGVFLTVLGMTDRLMIASGAAVVAQIAGFLVCDVLVIRELPTVDWTIRSGKRVKLLKDNTLLFFSVVIDFYIFSASKYAIEACMTDGDMAVFGAIFMPTSVINLVAGFVIRPFLTKMSLSWELNDRKRFVRSIGILAGVISALTVLALGCAWFLGIPVLSLLYSNISYALADCRPAFVLIILGGALNAFMSLFYYAMVIMKMQKYIFGVYGVVGVMAVLISNPFVEWGGILGGALAYVILTAALMVLFGAFVCWGVLRKMGGAKE